MKIIGSKSFSHEDFLAIKDELTANLADALHKQFVLMGSDVRLISWFSAAARAETVELRAAA